MLDKYKPKEVFVWTIKNKSDINNIWKYETYNNFGLITDYPILYWKEKHADS